MLANYQQHGRRCFLKLGSLAAANLLLGSCGSAGESDVSSMKSTQAKITAGIQLYTVRDQLALDAAATLNALANIGYQEVELAGLPKNTSASEFKRMLDDAGLICPAMHVQGDVSSQADIANTLGASYVVKPMAREILDDNWQPRPDLGLDDFRAISASLNRNGAAYQQHGLRFGYHNHAWELQLIDGQLPYEILLTDTDASLVFMELDLGWAHVGRLDVPALFTRHPGRFKTCHIKDFNSQDQIVDLGEGRVAFKEPLALRGEAGIEHFFVEHDNSKAPTQTAEKAIGYLQRIGMLSS